ncbi:hypothetical protein GCM10010533_01440 [Mycolicibacterium pallens]
MCNTLGGANANTTVRAVLSSVDAAAGVDDAVTLLNALGVLPLPELASAATVLLSVDTVRVDEVSAWAGLGALFPGFRPAPVLVFDADCRPVWPPGDVPADVPRAASAVDEAPVSAEVSACATPAPVARAAPTPRLSAPAPSQA